MDYAALKTADQALDIADPAAAAVALNAQTVTLTTQKFSWSVARRVARESATGDWSRIVARARLQPTLPPAALADFAILAAINAVESADSDMIDPGDAGSWGAWQAGIGALHAIGDLSSATVAALAALSTQTRPSWDPPVDECHVRMARSS